jgi:predicted TIM-barrel fold metal-dependent hydrolase
MGVGRSLQGLSDCDAEAQGHKKRQFLDYFQDNFVMIANGTLRTSAFMNLMAETKLSNILFSVDYPYKSIAKLREWFETIPVSDETGRDVEYRNAIRLFGLPLDYDT